MKKQKITYSQTGVNYEAMDPVKILAQLRAKETANNINRFGMSEVSESRGESAYVWEENDVFRAFVIEGLGTKNLIADDVRKITGKTHYDAIGQDTVAAIVNDLLVVGADPQVVNAYFAVGNSEWFNDQERAKDLVEGFANACHLSGAVWGGGETPTLKNVIDPETIDLGGAAVGIVSPKDRLVLGNTLTVGDAIILLESSGFHTNGSTLARSIAAKLSNGYEEKLSDGQTFGESLLIPTYIYANIVRKFFETNIGIHYMVHITGHGWRKLMRAKQDFTYVINNIPTPQPIFDFLQEHSRNTDEEMYGNFNMGAGFAIFVAEEDAEKTIKIAAKNNLKAWNAGVVEKGDRQVIIKPKNITYKGETLNVRI
jgi:phosphoribosylformylglycinamidine cyclo-ligase